MQRTRGRVGYSYANSWPVPSCWRCQGVVVVPAWRTARLKSMHLSYMSTMTLSCWRPAYLICWVQDGCSARRSCSVIVKAYSLCCGAEDSSLPAPGTVSHCTTQTFGHQSLEQRSQMDPLCASAARRCVTSVGLLAIVSNFLLL